MAFPLSIALQRVLWVSLLEVFLIVSYRFSFQFPNVLFSSLPLFNNYKANTTTFSEVYLKTIAVIVQSARTDQTLD